MRSQRAATTGSIACGNGRRAITTHESASPGMSTPSQNDCAPKSTVGRFARRRVSAISSRLGPEP